MHAGYCQPFVLLIFSLLVVGCINRRTGLKSQWSWPTGLSLRKE